METGKGSDFRRPSALESVAATAARLLPARVRGVLRGGFRRALATIDPASLVSELPGGERIRQLPALRQVTWNPEEYHAFRRDVRPGDIVFDVGANLGAYTLLFAQWVGDGGRVFAFEPAAEPFSGLRQLLDANGVSARVTASRAAVAATEGNAAFLVATADGESRIVGEARDGTVSVPMTTIDAVCQRERILPRLIKIDVEGAELDVLRGARQTIASAGADLKLYVEMHPHLWEAAGVTRQAIAAELSRQRLRAERLDGHPDIWNVEGVCLRLVPDDAPSPARETPCAS